MLNEKENPKHTNLKKALWLYGYEPVIDVRQTEQLVEFHIYSSLLVLLQHLPVLS